MEKKKYRGVALIGTTAALIAWILLAYGIFTVQSSQFEMLISSRDTTNAQKLAEVDASLLKMINYENITNNSALSDVNLHLERGAIQSIPADGWQDEIIISEEKLNSNDPDYGRFRVATINIYQDGDTKPRFSMQVPITKSRQTYSRNTIDEFIEALREKDRQLEAKDRELEAKDRELEAKDNEISAKTDSVKSSLLSEIDANRCTCTGSNDDSGSGSNDDSGSGSNDDSGSGNSPSIDPHPSTPQTGEQVIGYISSGGNIESNVPSYDCIRDPNVKVTFTAPVDGFIKLVNRKPKELYWGDEYYTQGLLNPFGFRAVILVDGAVPSEILPTGTQTITYIYDDGEGSSYEEDHEQPIYGNYHGVINVKAGQTFSYENVEYYVQSVSDTDDSTVYNWVWDFDLVFVPE